MSLHGRVIFLRADPGITRSGDIKSPLFFDFRHRQIFVEIFHRQLFSVAAFYRRAEISKSTKKVTLWSFLFFRALLTFISDSRMHLKHHRMTDQLSSRQIDKYQQDGFLVIEQFLTKEELEVWREAVGA